MKNKPSLAERNALYVAALAALNHRFFSAICVQLTPEKHAEYIAALSATIAMHFPVSKPA